MGQTGICIGGPASGQTKSCEGKYLAVPQIIRQISQLSYGYQALNTAAEFETFYYRFESSGEHGLWIPANWSIKQMFAFIGEELSSIQRLREIAKDGDPTPVWEAMVELIHNP